MKAPKLLWLFATLAGAATPDQIEFFEKQIRPLLVAHCHACHSSKSKAAFAGLRLDSAAGLRKGSDRGPVVVPGKPSESRLLQAVRGELPQRMPPAGALPAAAIEAIGKWILMGAPWPDEAAPTAMAPAAFDLEQRRASHWAWQPVRAVEPPPAAGGTHPVDRFLGVAIAAKGLQPAGRADALTLLRRVTFDLTGLPPAAADIAAFARDSSPAAYERLVDRLIASPRFGERWARRWMDVIRYSESHGSEGDPDVPQAWRYRDYLIRAFNAGVPYDQLIREHLAGDLLPEPRIDRDLQLNESLLGTAHLRMVEHGFQPVDPWEDRVKWTDNQIDVFSKAFQGLTISCARCHDHKFDAISQRDFYALFGVFAGARPTQVAVDAPQRIGMHRDALVPLKDRIRKELAAVWRERIPGITAKLGEGARGTPAGLWSLLRGKTGAELREAWQREGAYWRTELAARATPAAFDVRQDYARWVRHGAGAPAAVSPPGAFSILPAGDRVLSGLYPAGVYSHLLSSKHGAVVATPRFPIETDSISLRLLGGNFSFAQLIVENYAVPRSGIYHMRFSPKKDEMGWVRWDTTYWKGFTAYIEFATFEDTTHAMLDPDDSKLKPRPEFPADGRSWFGVQQIVFHNGEKTPPDPAIPAAALLFGDAPAGASLDAATRHFERTLHAAVDAWERGTMSEEQAALLDWFVRQDLLPAGTSASPGLDQAVAEYRRLEAEIPVAWRAPGVVEEAPPPQPLLVRGNHKNPGEPVPQRYLTALHGRAYTDARTARLALAQEVAHPGNPLTSRVMVNRIWYSLFRRGLVRTVDNFGKLGDPPSHPELLDYLAARFVSDGWSIKKMVRLLATSDAYQRASEPSAEARRIDPENVWLSHQNLRRLEAEEIRDAVLAASQQLDLKMFGPSVDTFYAHDTGKTKGDKPKGPLDGLGRRSVYLEVRRNVAHPFLEVFDVPKPSTTRGERDTTTVPAQSLALLNSEFLIDQCARWGARLAGSPAERVDAVFQAALGRPARPAERDESLTYVQSLAAGPGAGLEDARAWSGFAHAVLNLKEFLYVR